jgi:hypothetical protein
MTETLTPEETLSIPLGSLTEAQVRINFGGGELTLGRASAGTLVSGTFDGGVESRSIQPGYVELQPTDIGWRLLRDGCETYWKVDLTAEIPVDLRLDTGASKSVIDLTPLAIRRLRLHTGASDTTIRLPAEGHTVVEVECGFAQVTMEVPAGVAARVRGTIALGETKVDQTRFPRRSDGWESPDFETALHRVDISVSGGFGSVRVV